MLFNPNRQFKINLGKLKKIIPGYGSEKTIRVLSLIALFLCFSVIVIPSGNKNNQQLYPSFKKTLNRILGQTASNSSLTFSPSSVNVDALNSFSLDVNLNTDGSDIYGTDVVLNFDASKFMVTGIATHSASTLKGFAPVVNATLPNYTFDPTKAIDNTAGILDFGVFTFDYNTEATMTAYKNTSPVSIATVQFQSKSVRSNTTSVITFKTEPPYTKDSNIIDTNLTDILGATNSATINIRAELKCRAAIVLTDPTPGLNDLQKVLTLFNQQCGPPCVEDVNGDGMIGLADLQSVLQTWGQTCPAS